MLPDNDLNRRVFARGYYEAKDRMKDDSIYCCPVSGETEFFRWPWNPFGGGSFATGWRSLNKFLLGLRQFRF